VAGENVLSFDNQGVSVKLTLNGTVTETLKGVVHLNLNKMACCIGEACIMWPKKPLGFEVSSLLSIVNDQIPKPPKRWTFEDVEFAGPGPFEVDGKKVTPNELRAHQGLFVNLLRFILLGTSFELWAGNNNLAFKDLGGGAVSIVLNGTVTHNFDHPLHLNINPMAVCIGDACVMWPAQKLPKPQREPTEEEFLASVKAKLGADYERLVKVIQSQPAPAPAKPAADDSHAGSYHGKFLYPVHFL
jgi:hypothetical protein